MKNDNVSLFVLVRNITYTYNDRNPNDSRYHRVSANVYRIKHLHDNAY